MLVAAFSPSPAPFIVLMALGFVIGVTGHVYSRARSSRPASGSIFIATLLLPLAIYATD